MLKILLALLLVCSACGTTVQPAGVATRDLAVVFLDVDAAAVGTDMAICANECSQDVTQVLDCMGTVVVQCTGNEVCVSGMCQSPCDEAKKAKSSVGCEYYAVDPAGFQADVGSCFAAIVANTSSVSVKLAVDYQGKALPLATFARIPVGQGMGITYQPLPAGGLPPGKVAILFLADLQGGPSLIHCPVQAGFTTADAAAEQTALINGFHITTTAPVVAYDIFPYGGKASAASSATLLIPTSAWDTSYIAIDSWTKSSIAGPSAQPFIQIAAMLDGTSVTIRPTVNIVGGGGVAAGVAGNKVVYQLKKGQVLQLMQDQELNGSVITSNNPVGVWGGASCMNIEVTDAYCDSAHQQLFPVKALGNEYVAVRYRDRVAGNVESPPWRILGVVAGTVLTYDPARPTNAPLSIGLGQVATFYTSEPFVVTSQDSDHPFYISGHMTGCQFKGNMYTNGDPEFVNVIPPAQYLAAYDFFTDATMNYTHLVMVRHITGELSFHDVTLDCVGTVKGWKPVGHGGQYEYARVDLVDAGASVGKCNNGYHTAKSDVPFGLTVWGWDQAVSYAYPAGAGAAAINMITIQ